MSVDVAMERLMRARAFYALSGQAPDTARLAELAQEAVRTDNDVAPVGEPPVPARAPSGGTPMGKTTTGLVASVKLRMKPLATSLAHLYALDPAKSPLVTVAVENAGDRIARVSVRCAIEGYSATAIDTFEIPAGDAHDFDLFPALFPAQTAKLQELTAAALQVRVDDLDGKTELERTVPIAMLPPTTAVLGYLDPSTGAQVDQRARLAAFVTPNAPAVLDLLRRAADFSKLRAMLGYQVGADDVREQVGAIYSALAAADIKYIDTRIAFGGAPGEVIQRVRLPRESLASKSANCIDGTVLMASLLEATGLDPFIVIVPGHAFLGYRTSPDGGALDYVETTLIGAKPFADARAAAADHLKLGNSLTLDVRALRAQGVTPME